MKKEKRMVRSEKMKKNSTEFEPETSSLSGWCDANYTTKPTTSYRRFQEIKV